MLLIKPHYYEFETTLNPKRVARKLDNELEEFRPSLNVFATGRFMRKHRLEGLYYGRREGEKFQLYYHKFKRRDGGETGFFGKVEKTSKGSRIYGKFRKPAYVYAVAVVWVLITLLMGLVCLSLKITGGAVAGGILLVAGVFFMFWDSKKKYLLSFLETFPKVNDENE